MEAQQKILNTLADTEALIIKKKMNGEDVSVDNEALERLKNSVELIGDLYIKGAEVRPSLTTKEDVSNLFPKSGLQHLIESRAKRITEGSGEGDAGSNKEDNKGQAE